MLYYITIFNISRSILVLLQMNPPNTLSGSTDGSLHLWRTELLEQGPILRTSVKSRLSALSATLMTKIMTRKNVSDLRLGGPWIQPRNQFRFFVTFLSGSYERRSDYLLLKYFPLGLTVDHCVSILHGATLASLSMMHAHMSLCSIYLHTV
jgi:hypothetical protein